MAVAAYSTWENQGRPLDPAQPIREVVEALQAAYPAAAAEYLFSWYADESHYQSSYPEDHTPFSYTGWPHANPWWFVHATDIMHRPDLGVDCNAIFAWWIAAARAGEVPWLKYIIWQGLLYDVRNGWEPVGNSGHFDHIHISARTDYTAAGLGGWSPIPGGDDMSREDSISAVQLAQQGSDRHGYADNGPEAVDAYQAELIRKYAIVQVEARLTALIGSTQAADETRDKATLAAITALTSGGSVEVAPIVAAITAVRDEARVRFGELMAQLNEANAEIDRLRAALAAGERAQADALEDNS
jgi:hypothetical protein